MHTRTHTHVQEKVQEAEMVRVTTERYGVATSGFTSLSSNQQIEAGTCDTQEVVPAASPWVRQLDRKTGRVVYINKSLRQVSLQVLRHTLHMCTGCNRIYTELYTPHVVLCGIYLDIYLFPSNA